MLRFIKKIRAKREAFEGKSFVVFRDYTEVKYREPRHGWFRRNGLNPSGNVAPSDTPKRDHAEEYAWVQVRTLDRLIVAFNPEVLRYLELEDGESAPRGSVPISEYEVLARV